MVGWIRSDGQDLHLLIYYGIYAVGFLVVTVLTVFLVLGPAKSYVKI